MFLSYATVAVFAYAILLNIFYSYSPVESGGVGDIYELCQDCLLSECHTELNRPCITRYDCEYNFTCFTCTTTEDGNEQFYSKDECTEGCKDSSKMCICDASCYMCIVKEGADLSKYINCTIPDVPEEPTCV